METTDIFTFYQNDHQSTSFEAFDKMRRKEQFCDLTIKVQNRAVTAHKIIVAAGIPYFQSAFDSIDSESEENEIGVEDNIDPTALESLILFAYTSKVDITVENVQSLLVTSQFLQLVQVRDACIEFQSKRLNIDNVVQIRELGVSLQCSLLTENCNNFIRHNFEEFSRTCDFLGLSHWCVKELVAEDDLVVSAEEVVFEAIMKWVSFSPSDREVSLPELLTEVRMIYLPVPYLMEQVDTQQLITQSKSCRDIVNEVKYYHLLPESRVKFVNVKCRPRNLNLYAFCSVDVNSDTHELSVFILVNNKWQALASTNVRRLSIHQVISLDDKIYIVAGKTTVLVFKLGSHEWECLKSFEHWSRGAAVVCHEKTIYCFGSFYSNFCRGGRGFDYKLNECCQTKQMEMGRAYAAAASQGEFIYVTGGTCKRPTDEDFSFTSSNTVEKYSHKEDTWISVSNMLIGRRNHGCTSLGGKIYVCGGTKSDDDGILNVAEMYDPVINRWSRIAPMQSGRNVISFVAHRNRIFAFGEKNAEVYEVETDEWKPCPFVPKPFRGAAAISASYIANDPRPMVAS